MAIGVVWLVVGLLWWGAILFGAAGVWSMRPAGRRGRPLAFYFAGVGTLVGSTALLPAIGVRVWVPIYFVLALPVVELMALLGR